MRTGPFVSNCLCAKVQHQIASISSLGKNTTDLTELGEGRAHLNVAIRDLNNAREKKAETREREERGEDKWLNRNRGFRKDTHGLNK